MNRGERVRMRIPRRKLHSLNVVDVEVRKAVLPCAAGTPAASGQELNGWDASRGTGL